MTSSLPLRARPLLEPDALKSATEILSGDASVPSSAGVYAVWLDRVPFELSRAPLSCGAWCLAYIGIAGATTGLRRRLGQHIRGACARSTLRRGLAALLIADLALDVALSPKRKLVLRSDGESKVSGWLARHGRFSWIEHSAPRTLEAALIGALAPPLNVVGSPVAHAIKQARAHLRARAVAR